MPVFPPRNNIWICNWKRWRLPDARKSSLRKWPDVNKTARNWMPAWAFSGKATLVVYKLDRFGRSLKNILTLLEDFKNRASIHLTARQHQYRKAQSGQLMNNILRCFSLSLKERPYLWENPRRQKNRQGKKVSNSAERHLSTKQTSPSRKAASNSMNPERR